MKKSVPKLPRLALLAMTCCLPLAPRVGQAAPSAAVPGPQAAADVPVSGRITDEKGAGLPGVSVVVKGTTQGTTTNADGTFSLSAPAGSTLAFTYVGYKTREATVTGANAVLSLSLEVDAQQLSDVVVVGYLAQDRQNVTSAVAPLDVKEAVKAPVATVVQAMQGRVAGVQIQGSGGPGDTPVILIRGAGTIGLSNSAPSTWLTGCGRPTSAT